MYSYSLALSLHRQLSVKSGRLASRERVFYSESYIFDPACRLVRLVPGFPRQMNWIFDVSLAWNTRQTYIPAVRPDCSEISESANRMIRIQHKLPHRWISAFESTLESCATSKLDPPTAMQVVPNAGIKLPQNRIIRWIFLNNIFLPLFPSFAVYFFLTKSEIKIFRSNFYRE